MNTPHISLNTQQEKSLWTIFNHVTETTHRTTQKAAPRTKVEIRPGDIVHIRPHCIAAPSWMLRAGRESMPVPHQFSDCNAEVLQLVPVSDSAIVRVQTKRGSSISAVAIKALDLLMLAED